MPMLIIALAQIQMAFNVSALPVSIGGIVESFNTSPSSVSTALVVYSLAVAAFVMLGAKLGKLLGARLAFQIGVILHGLAMGLMAVSGSAEMMIQVQGLAGLAAALLVPTLVVLIASHYKGPQQAQALGYLGAAQASAGIAAFLITGIVGELLGWRVPFGLIVFLAVAVVGLSFRLKSAERQRVSIDLVGAILAAIAIPLISLGFNFLNSWGLLLARPAAPFSILGLSPAPVFIVLGIVVGQGFFTWTAARERDQKSSLIALAVLDSAEERAALFCLLIIGGLGPAVNFLIPLYIQIVQGRSGLETAVTVIPYSLAIFAGTAFSVRFFGKLHPRQIGWIAFAVVTLGLIMLSFTVSNNWGTLPVIVSLVVLGLGEGTLLTLLFTVLVSSSPKELAGDVGALRGTANNLSTAVGTALASVLAIGILTLNVTAAVAGSAVFTPALLEQVSLESVDFISNDQLDDVLSQTPAAPAEVDAAVRINEEARLRALKLSFLILAGVAALAIFPASGLPNYFPGEIPSGERPAPEGNRRRKSVQAAS